MSNDKGSMTVTGNVGPGRAPGGNGNNGGHSGNKGDGNAGNNKTGSMVAKSVGDQLARGAGLDPSIFKNYFIGDEGDVIGVRFVDGSPTVPAGATVIGTYGVRLGPLPSGIINGTGNPGATPKPVINDNIKFMLTSPRINLKGDISDARLKTLNNTIAFNKLDAESGQAGQRVRNAKKATSQAKAEISLINEIRDKNKNDEGDFLLKSSYILSGTGNELGKLLGDKYSTIANEIAEDIKNFQGKKIRSYDDALKSINKITKNPAMVINDADKVAITNAIKSLEADDIAKNIKGISKSFAYANLAVKIENVRQKTIIGFENGDWGPLMLEVESWVVGGLVAGGALAILSNFVAPYLALLLGIPLTAVTIAGVIIIGILASFIDDKLVDRINNELIKPAH